MVKTINTEVATLLLIGALLTILGLYWNFQNLDIAHERNNDLNVLRNNEIAYSLLQFIGVAIIFIGATRGLLKRSDVMANKFVNIMDVFTGLVKKEMEVIDDKGRQRNLSDIEEKSRKFKSELRDLRRL